MNEEDARKILGSMIQEDNSLYDEGQYISWRKGEVCFLDAGFNVNELEAIAWWMRNK